MTKISNQEHALMSLLTERSTFEYLLKEQERWKKAYCNPKLIASTLNMFQCICAANNKLEFPSCQKAPMPIRVIDIIKTFLVYAQPMDYVDAQVIILATDGKRYRMSWLGPASGSMRTGFDEEFYWSRIPVLRKTAIADWFRARLTFSRKK